MIATTKPFVALTASDLMSRDVVVIPKEMSLRAAAHLLSQHQISGAPIVDKDGRCIGVVSATDFLQWIEKHEVGARPNRAHTSCYCDWHVLEPDKLPADRVVNSMTANPVTVPPDTPIDRLARLMLDAHIHRLIVVDNERRPIGVVSSTDILAAVAFRDSRSRTREVNTGIAAIEGW
jgi:CBS domain-containing protein